MAENNYKISQRFELNRFRTWKKEILKESNRGNMEMHKVELIAINCVLGFKFDENNYNTQFFHLLCEAQKRVLPLDKDVESDSDYPTNEDTDGTLQLVRPRLFKDFPKEESKEGFCFVWPVTYNDGGQETKAPYYVGIPNQYLRAPNCSSNSQSGEGQNDECGTLCAILFLIASDTIGSFKNCICESRSWVEIPCLLEYYAKSPTNNKNNLPALIGEYFALLQVSFHCNYDGNHCYEPTEKISDFKIIAEDGEVEEFSVKTYNRNGTLRFFNEGIIDPSSKAPVKTNHKKTKSAILILNCLCNGCTLKPTVALCTLDQARSERRFQDCRRFQSADIIKEIYGDAHDCKHYITSGRNFFDLRFAMFRFDHNAFRNCNNCRDSPTPTQGYSELMVKHSRTLPANGVVNTGQSKCLTWEQPQRQVS